MPAPLYKKALIIGATSGIGEALANRLVEQGTSVVAVGRRQERLEALVNRHKSNSKVTVASKKFDISELDRIPMFAKDIISQNNDLDCIIMNAGIQRGYNFTEPESVSLSNIDQEVIVNYLSYVHLSMAFLPHLQSLAPNPTYMIYISSGLALLPALVRSANYCATKAALHSYLLGLRTQLQVSEKSKNVSIVEVFPPAVQTELHSTFNQPDLVNGEELGIPLEQFTNELLDGLGQRKDQIPVGSAAAAFAPNGFETIRQNGKIQSIHNSLF